MYWAGVGGGEIELRIGQRRIEFLGLLEILDGGIGLTALVGLDALIELVAGAEACRSRRLRRARRPPRPEEYAM